MTLAKALTLATPLHVGASARCPGAPAHFPPGCIVLVANEAAGIVVLVPSLHMDAARRNP